ncbi:MAG: ATP-binding protein, partial [Clostridiaceae bacterium]
MNVLVQNNPTADVLMVSMRSMGYTFESAVADIIDNSITAESNQIKLFFPIDPSDCYVAICDNGHGMSKEDLIDAMKYGSENKANERHSKDLGRFGLGLKSASLSQCRRLTVASKKDDIISAFIWDIDVISENKGWYMIECNSEQISQIKQISYLDDLDSGTIVLWEKFDFIKKSSGNVYAELSKYKDTTEKYLSLIFHRYLNKGNNEKISININNYSLTGLDPFLEDHPKTNIRRKVVIAIEDSNGTERNISVQPYILPFQKDLT